VLLRRLLLPLAFLAVGVLIGLPIIGQISPLPQGSIGGVSGTWRTSDQDTLLFLTIANTVLTLFSIFLYRRIRPLRLRTVRSEHVDSKSSRRKVRRAPGTKMLKLTQLCFSRENFERVLQPIYSDFCIEYHDALASGAKLHASLIRFRFVVNFAGTAISLAPIKTLRKLWDLAFSL